MNWLTEIGDALEMATIMGWQMLWAMHHDHLRHGAMH
jgi:hypothetical protein